MNYALQWNGNREQADLRRAAATIAAYEATSVAIAALPDETPTPEATIIGSGSPRSTFRDEAPTVQPTYTPWIVTATPEPPTATPNVIYEYFQVPVEVEVERIVTTTVVLEPTATPALAEGTAKICVALEGAREVFIGGHGVVSGGCQTFTFGVGQTSIAVQINK